MHEITQIKTYRYSSVLKRDECKNRLSPVFETAHEPGQCFPIMSTNTSVRPCFVTKLNFWRFHIKNMSYISGFCLSVKPHIQHVRWDRSYGLEMCSSFAAGTMVRFKRNAVSSSVTELTSYTDVNNNGSFIIRPVIIPRI